MSKQQKTDEQILDEYIETVVLSKAEKSAFFGWRQSHGKHPAKIQKEWRDLIESWRPLYREHPFFLIHLCGVRFSEVLFEALPEWIKRRVKR